MQDRPQAPRTIAMHSIQSKNVQLCRKLWEQHQTTEKRRTEVPAHSPSCPHIPVGKLGLREVKQHALGHTASHNQQRPVWL